MNDAVMGRPQAVVCAAKWVAAASIVAWKVVALSRGMYSHAQTRSTSSAGGALQSPHGALGMFTSKGLHGYKWNTLQTLVTYQLYKHILLCITSDGDRVGSQAR